MERKKNHIELFYRCALAEHALTMQRERAVNELQIALVRFLFRLCVKHIAHSYVRIMYVPNSFYNIRFFFFSLSLSAVSIFFPLLHFCIFGVDATSRTLTSVIICFGIFIFTYNFEMNPAALFFPRSSGLSSSEHNAFSKCSNAILWPFQLQIYSISKRNAIYCNLYTTFSRFISAHFPEIRCMPLLLLLLFPRHSTHNVFAAVVENEAYLFNRLVESIRCTLFVCEVETKISQPKCTIYNC